MPCLMFTMVYIYHDRKSVPSSHGSGQILQSANEIGTDAAFKSEMTPSDVMVSASVPMTRAFIFLAVAKTTMSGGMRRMGGVKRTHIHHS